MSYQEKKHHLNYTLNNHRFKITFPNSEALFLESLILLYIFAICVNLYDNKNGSINCLTFNLKSSHNSVEELNFNKSLIKFKFTGLDNFNP